MTNGAALLIRVARWLAGEPRREWVDAMAAEAETLGAADLEWALGCLWAAAKDRIWRERTTLALIVAVPIVAMGMQMLFFFPEVWLLRQGLLPSWAFPVIAIIKPLPLVWLLGRWCAHVALSAAALSFVISALLPGLIFWAKFDASPLDLLRSRRDALRHAGRNWAVRNAGLVDRGGEAWKPLAGSPGANVH